MGIETDAKGRNDLNFEGRKISGSAFEVDLGGRTVKRRVLHHGTILINVDLEFMTHLLNPNVLKLKSKGVDSIKARVLNLQDRFPDINPTSIIDSVTSAFYDHHDIDNKGIEFLTNKDLYENDEIRSTHAQLTDEKWILGECASFSNSFETKFDWGLVELQLEVDKGFVSNCKIYSDSLYPDFIDSLEGVIRTYKPRYRSNDLGMLRAMVEVDGEVQKKHTKEFFDWIEKVMSD